MTTVWLAQLHVAPINGRAGGTDVIGVFTSGMKALEAAEGVLAGFPGETISREEDGLIEVRKDGASVTLDPLELDESIYE